MLAGAPQAAAAGATSVSKTTGLNPGGDTITVTGNGFDVNKGIYVAVCVDNGPGQVPTPCLGGVDTSGGSGGSAWISSNPPSYGTGLAVPYGPGGSFSVTLPVTAVDPVTGTDCRVVVCAAVTRSDHTRTADRSQDTRVPLSFGEPAPPPAPEPTPEPTTTTTAPPPTTTTPPPTTTTTTTTQPPAAPALTAAETPDRTGWWLAGGVAALLLAVAVVLLVRRVRPNRPDTTTASPPPHREQGTDDRP